MISRRKRWIYRVLMALGGPAIFLLACEGVLRLAGYGYSASFLLPSAVNGRAVLVSNPRFAWRFFGPSFARQPASFAIPRRKPDNTVRIFVLGESAAFGDPQPAFGLPRMLQALLNHRYPAVRFEVVNAAVTGINSHAIVPIARDAARADGDLWVIFMGNNEVVGPFGAGTVFGPQAPRRAIIEGSLAIKSTRSGQLLAALQRFLHQPPASKSEWGGMLMFLENQVRSDDPRLSRMYRHFERNLDEILDEAKEAGTRVVVSTVPVNLKDCAPFASRHRPGLAAAEIENWKKLYHAAIDAQAAGQQKAAIGHLQEAMQIDDSFAELHFALARSLLSVGKQAEAARAFALARDEDVLRFRCDSKLNKVIRRLASGRVEDQVLLADAERAFAQESADGAPGAEFFYEHVHLTFEGNYLLARTIAEQLEKLLPERVRRSADGAQTWPSVADAARQLAFTPWHRLAAVSDILGRRSDSPFTSQSNDAEQIQWLQRQAEELREPAQQALGQAKSLFEEALAAWPDDPVLYEQLATMLGSAGDVHGATSAAERAIELLPTSAENWMLLGASLATREQFDEAAQAFQTAFRLDAQNVWALQNLGRSYAKLNRREEAIEAYRQAIALKPRFGPAYLELGQLLEAQGREAEAEQNYRKALENRIHRSAELVALAQFCQNRGWHEEAARNYLDAIKLSRSDAALHLRLGRSLAALGRHAEARSAFQEAVRLAPESGEARFLLALELGRANEAVAATEQFREAVRLMPNTVEARLNLAIALQQQGRREEAREQFRKVLDHSPNNAIALNNLRLLEAAAAEQPAK